MDLLLFLQKMRPNKESEMLTKVQNLEKAMLSLESMAVQDSLSSESAEDFQSSIESLLGFRRSEDFHRLTFEERCRVIEKINDLMRTSLVQVSKDV